MVAHVKGFVANITYANWNEVGKTYGNGDPTVPMEDCEHNCLIHWFANLDKVTQKFVKPYLCNCNTNVFARLHIWCYNQGCWNQIPWHSHMIVIFCSFHRGRVVGSLDWLGFWFFLLRAMEWSYIGCKCMPSCYICILWFFWTGCFKRCNY